MNYGFCLIDNKYDSFEFKLKSIKPKKLIDIKFLLYKKGDFEYFKLRKDRISKSLLKYIR